MTEVTVNTTNIDVDVQVSSTSSEVAIDVTTPAPVDVQVDSTSFGPNIVTSQTGSDGTADIYLNSLRFNTAPTGTFSTPGTFSWNNQEGTLDLIMKGGNVRLQVGQENVIRVVNKTGADLLESEFRVVRVRKQSEGGAQGQRLAVVLAQGSTEMASTDVIGVVTENIANNQEGFITTFGTVNNINTTGASVGETWLDGDILFLSPTNPGRMTKVKPTAPNHLVIVGYVQYAHANNGKLFVKTETSYELEELHNVKLTSPQDGQFLRYNDTTGLWENQSFTVVIDPGTSTGLTGFLVGDGTEISAVLGSSDADPETVVQRDSSGSASFYSISSAFSVSVGNNSLTASPTTGAFLLFNAGSQYAIAVSSTLATDNRNIEFPDNSGTVALVNNPYGYINSADIFDASTSNSNPSTVPIRDVYGNTGVVADWGPVVSSTNIYVDNSGLQFDNGSPLSPDDPIVLPYFGLDSNNNHIWGGPYAYLVPEYNEHIGLFYDPNFSEPASTNVGAWLFSVGNGLNTFYAYAADSTGLSFPPPSGWVVDAGFGSIDTVWVDNSTAPSGSLVYDYVDESLNLAVGPGEGFTTKWLKIPTAPLNEDVVPVFIQDTQPTLSPNLTYPGKKYLWFDTSGGNLQIKYEDGL